MMDFHVLFWVRLVDTLLDIPLLERLIFHGYPHIAFALATNPAGGDYIKKDEEDSDTH